MPVTTTIPLTPIKEQVRIGYQDVAASIKSGFNWRTYQGSALTTIDTTITSSETDGIIRVPFKKSVEVEVEYEELDLILGRGLRDASAFEVIPHGKERSESVTHAGSGRSWMIEKTRAIAYLSPWVHVPYGEEGTATLVLTLETRDGRRLVRRWPFRVGANPAVSKE